MRELTCSLALIRIEILRKTNLQPGNEEIEVKTSISVAIKCKDSAEILFRAFDIKFMLSSPEVDNILSDFQISF